MLSTYVEAKLLQEVIDMFKKINGKKLYSMLAVMILGGLLLTGCGNSDDDDSTEADNGAEVTEVEDGDDE